MNEEDAKSLVNKLINAVFVVGQNHRNQSSLLYKSEEKKALKLSDEIRRQLTTSPSRAVEACADWKVCSNAQAGCNTPCPRYNPLPA